MIDKRAARRERVFKAGKVSFGCERVDCTVRNLSVTGAMIEVRTSDVIPHEIILDIAGPWRAFSLSCRLETFSSARRGLRLGIEFTSLEGLPWASFEQKCQVI